MAKPSKAGSIILFVFGLPFFAFGAYASFAFFTSAPSVHNNTSPIAAGIFASVFAIIGGGLMFAAVYSYRWAQQQAAVREANPDTPWLWRDDWAQSRAISRHRNTVYSWWVGTVLAGMIIVPIAITNIPPMLSRSDPKVFWLLGLCLIPAALLAGALRATLRRRRYGQTCFEFASLPFSPGRRLSGQIQLRLDTAAEHGIDLRLSCLRRIVTGTGKQESVNETPLWQQEKNVPQASLMIGPLGTLIPVEFELPPDAYETNHDVPRDQVFWLLHAQADVPGVDYSDDFEIPVFRAAGKAARASAAAGDTDWSAEFRPGFAADSRASHSADVPTPEHPRVVVSTTTEGATEFYFPAFRNPRGTIFLLLFTTVWTLTVYGLAHSKAPWFLGAIFGFFDLLAIYWCLQGLFGTARIVVGDGTLTSRRGVFGTGARVEIPFSDIESVQAAAGVQNSSAWNASYTIRVRTRSGRSLTLADSIADREEARWVVGQIEKLAGLKVDTQVVLQNLGRDLGPPPQRGSV